ncbi:hypothetical protein STEG23_020604, partial [Scotinomys teguina]
MLKAKILFVGPCESGKTVLANFLTDSSDITEYNPTQGVRILEFENPHVTSNNKGTGCEFELWDCGGDSKVPVVLLSLMVQEASGTHNTTTMQTRSASFASDVFLEP